MSDTGYYGLDHPNPDGRAGGRRRPVSRLRGGAVHVSVNVPSTHSAEDVARFQSTQRYTYSGYNVLFDSDGTLPYFPDDRAPNGARGGNQYGKYNDILVHLSAACKPDTWARYKNWSELVYGFMAVEVRRLSETYDWPYRLLTKSELDRGLKGFITHHRLDPSRRTDPGAKADGFGEFSFEYLFALAAGEEPEPTPIPDPEAIMQLKNGDPDSVLVRQLVHTVNAVIVHTGGWTHAPDQGNLIPIGEGFTNAVAERLQHAIWRAEGWVLGYPLYAEEEGGSRCTLKTLGDLQYVAHGLRNGTLDTNPSTSVTKSGLDLKDAQAVAEFIRKEAAK